MFYGNEGDLGGVRDKVSRALIFPVHPREKEEIKKRQEFDQVLAEVKQLKEELIELKNSLTKEE